MPSIFVDVTKGLQDQIDPKLLPQGALGEAMNAIYDKDGRLAKRPGSSVVTIPGTPGRPYRIGAVRNRPFLIPQSGATPVYLDNAPQDAIKSSARFNIRPRAYPVVADESAKVQGVDIATDTSSGTSCIVYTHPDGTASLVHQATEVVTTIVDSSTGIPLYSLVVPGARNARVIKVGSYYCVVYFNWSNQQVVVQRWTTSSLAAGPTTLTIGTGDLNYYVRNQLHLYAHTDSHLYVLYEAGIGAAGGQFTVRKYNPATNTAVAIGTHEVGFGLDTNIISALGWVENATVPTVLVQDDIYGLTAWVLNPTTLAVTNTYFLVGSATNWQTAQHITGYEENGSITAFWDQLNCVAGWITADFPLIAAGAKSTFLFTLTGAKPGDRIDFIRPPILGTQIRLSIEVSSANLVAITMENTSAVSGLNPVSMLFYVRATTDAGADVVNYCTRTSGGAVTTDVAFRGVSLATRCIKRTGKPGALVGAVHDNDLDAAYFLYDAVQPNPEPQLTTTPGRAVGRVRSLSAINEITPDHLLTSLAARTRIKATEGFVVEFATGLDLVALGFDDASTSPCLMCGPPIEAADSVLVPGGILRSLDGVKYTPMTPPWAPSAPTCVVSSPGTSDLTTGTYSYRIVLRWVDQTGRFHRSAPSPATSVVVPDGSGDVVTVTVPFNGVMPGTAQEGYIEIYRTVSNGALFQLRATIPVATTISLIDSGSDAQLADEPFIYTTGGVLPNEAPPPLSFVVNHQNRVWGINAEHPNQIWVSKVIRDGEGVSFSSALVLTHDEGGAAIALASQDDRLYIFKESGGVYALAGGAPNELAQGEFGRPQLIGSVGEVEPRSIVVADEGVYLQASGKYYRISRGLAVEYIGGGVETTTTAAMSAVADPSNQRIVWTTSTGALVFDRRRGAWTVWTGFRGYAAMLPLGIHCTSDVAGTPFVWRQRPDLSIDGDNSNVLMTITTPWLQLGGPGGEWRFQELQPFGTRAGAHTFQVTLLYDFDTSPVEILTSSPDERFEVGVRPKRQRTSALKIVFAETYIGAATKGYTLSGYRIEYQAKSGRHIRVGRMRS